MRFSLLFHVLCGLAGLLSGYVALYATKGAPAHRKSGMVFVCVMLAVSVTGFMMSVVNGDKPALNIVTAALTFYLVVTGLITVQPAASSMRWLAQAAMALAFVTGLACAAIAVISIGRGGPATFVAYPMLMFSAVATGGGIGDLRVLRGGPLTGGARLKRHLWRMCFALFVASIAIFPSNRLPEALRIPAFQVAGTLLPLAAMLFWLWRLRKRRSAQAAGRLIATEAA
jgi:uncharacterized membrane protein